jgi:amino acid transporter
MLFSSENRYMAQLTLSDSPPSGIVSGLVIGVFSFVGFESATTLGSEAKDPLMFGVKPLDNYAYAGTIATYGFLVAYILISIAAPIYLARRGQLQPLNIVVSVVAVIFMLIPVSR